MNSRTQLPGEKLNISDNLTPRGRDPLRVAVIAEDLRLPLDEGAKKATFSLIHSFKKKGATVSVFTGHRNLLLDNVHPLPENKFLLGYSFSRSLRAQMPDVILYVPASSGTVGAFIRAAAIKTQSLGIPLALFNLQYRELPEIVRYFSLKRYADIVFTQSQASTGVFRSIGCKTVMLPGGVDHTIFRPVSKEEQRLLRLKYGFDDKDRIVLHIGHGNRSRNVIALTRLVTSGFKVVLVVSSSTVIDHNLLERLGRSGVNVMTGFIENIQHFYQIADCYVFPVLHATSAIDAPLSVLEAMACNLPIVTTRFGALPDMFQAGNGLYYADTEEEIVGMVNQAMKEQDCRTFEKVSLNSWDHVASALLETLEDICKR